MARSWVSRFMRGVAIAALISVNAVAVAPGPVLAAPGDIDPTFGTDGIVLTDFGMHNNPAYALAVGPADEIYVAGSATNGLNMDAFLARFTPDGALDPSFAEAGVATVSFGKKNNESFHNDAALAIAIQDDGRIVIAGSVLGASPTGGFSSTLARFEPDGTLDPSFGKRGKVVAAAVGPISDIAIAPDGSILATGTTSGRPGGTDIGVARFTAKGALDKKFGKKGVVGVDWGSFQEYATAVIVDGEGRIVVAGYGVLSSSPIKLGITVERFTAGGKPDKTFGTGGRMTLDLADGGKAFEMILHQGKPLIVGSLDNPGGTPNDGLLFRLLDDGTLDPDFGVDGMTTTTRGAATFDQFFGVTLDPAGGIIAAGASGDGVKDVAAVAKFGPDGTVDPTFNGGAIVTTEFAGNAYHADVGIQSLGRIVAGGRTQYIAVAARPLYAAILGPDEDEDVTYKVAVIDCTNTVITVGEIDVTVGSTIRQDLNLSTFGGVGPYTYDSVSASPGLPQLGLGVSENGTLSGQVRGERGTYTVTATITDARGCTSTVTFVIEVAPIA